MGKEFWFLWRNCCFSWWNSKLFRNSWLFRPHFWNNGVCISIYCCSLNSFLFWPELFLLHFSLILVQIWIQILPFFSIFVCFEHPYWLIFPFCTFFGRNWIVFDRLLIKKNLILHPHISISNQILNNFDLCSKLATMKNCFIKCLEAYNQHFFKGLHAVGQRIAIWDRKETISKGRLHSAEKFLESPWGHKTYKNESRCVSSNSWIQVFLTHPKWATT